MKSLNKRLLARNAMALMLSLALTTGSTLTMTATASSATSIASKSQTITRQEAIAIAQKKVKNGTLVGTYINYKKGRMIYVVKILGTGNTLYKYNIDSYSGEIIYTYRVRLHSKKAEKLRTAKISADKAIQIAKEDSGATILVSCKLDVEDGTLVYEVELTDSDETEYEWVIDAKTGKVIDSEVDYDD